MQDRQLQGSSEWRRAMQEVDASVFQHLRDNIKVMPDAKWTAIMSALHGRVNYTKADVVVKITCPVFGEYNTSKTAVMYPAAFTTPAPGTSLGSDSALVINAKNDDQMTFHNAFVSGVPNIYLCIDKDIWASDIEFTALINREVTEWRGQVQREIARVEMQAAGKLNP